MDYVSHKWHQVVCIPTTNIAGCNSWLYFFVFFFSNHRFCIWKYLKLVWTAKGFAVLTYQNDAVSLLLPPPLLYPALLLFLQSVSESGNGNGLGKMKHRRRTGRGGASNGRSDPGYNAIGDGKKQRRRRLQIWDLRIDRGRWSTGDGRGRSQNPDLQTNFIFSLLFTGYNKKKRNKLMTGRRRGWRPFPGADVATETQRGRIPAAVALLLRLWCGDEDASVAAPFFSGAQRVGLHRRRHLSGPLILLGFLHGQQKNFKNFAPVKLR